MSVGQHIFQYVKIILQLFCAIVKFCSTNRLFMTLFFNVSRIFIKISLLKLMLYLFQSLFCCKLLALTCNLDLNNIFFYLDSKRSGPRSMIYFCAGNWLLKSHLSLDLEQENEEYWDVIVEIWVLWDTSFLSTRGQ